MADGPVIAGFTTVHVNNPIAALVARDRIHESALENGVDDTVASTMARAACALAQDALRNGAAGDIGWGVAQKGPEYGFGVVVVDDGDGIRDVDGTLNSNRVGITGASDEGVLDCGIEIRTLLGIGTAVEFVTWLSAEEVQTA